MWHSREGEGYGTVSPNATRGRKGVSQNFTWVIISKILNLFLYFGLLLILAHCISYSRCDFKVVQCSTVEAALMKHDDVFDCAAFAEISLDHGEVPSAWVILRPGITYDKVFSIQICKNEGPVHKKEKLCREAWKISISNLWLSVSAPTWTILSITWTTYLLGAIPIIRELFWTFLTPLPPTPVWLFSRPICL